MHRFNAVLSDILSEAFDALVWKRATKDISDEKKQFVSLVKRMHYVTGQCLECTCYFYCH